VYEQALRASTSLKVCTKLISYVKTDMDTIMLKIGFGTRCEPYFLKIYLFLLKMNCFLIFLYRFDVPISKIIFKK
jgi:hypothetical protein